MAMNASVFSRVRSGERPGKLQGPELPPVTDTRPRCPSKLPAVRRREPLTRPGTSLGRELFDDHLADLSWIAQPRLADLKIGFASSSVMGSERSTRLSRASTAS